VFAIGVSYGIQNTGANQLSSPTYEIHLGYLFGKHKKENFAYSFVDTHKEKEKKEHTKSTSEQLAQKHQQEEAQHKKEELERKKKLEEEQALARMKEQETKRQHDELVKKQQ